MSSNNELGHDVVPSPSSDRRLSKTLSRSQSASLKKAAKARSHTHAHPDDGHGHGHGHGHGPKPHSILTATASAIINFLLMFGLCCAYGMIMFEDSWNAQHRGLGVKMNLASALLVGTLLSLGSKVKVAIGGPDLNPVVFLGMFVQRIADDLADQHGLTLPGGGRRLLETCGAALQNWDPQELLRRLGESASADVDFCDPDKGTHYQTHGPECDAYHAELRATTVFAVSVSSAILGTLFFCLGRFKLTRLVTYVPTNIMEAFLSCVGYKVFKYALKFCKYEPQQFIMAACIGVPLYFMKALHLGNPAVVIPIVLLVPLAAFYAIVYGTGSDVQSAREAGWMFDPPIENYPFWVIWTSSIGSPSNINFKAWAKSLMDLPIMLVVCVLDCMLKLSSTENKLPVKADKDYEIQLYGAGNALTTLFGSSVGYMQLKFNVINFGVMGNVTDRRGGLIYALLCGAFYFGSIELFNYLPRFFLSTLLFFAGAGFVAENLWGSRKYLSLWEWLQIFIILGVFIFSESLLAAVIVGGLITGVAFIVRYAKVPCIQGRPMKGGEVQSLERHSLSLRRSIQLIADSWLLVIRLKGFVFFASAQKLTDWVAAQIDAQKEQGIPMHRRIKWVVFDCAMLDGLDSSASKAMGKLTKKAKENDVHILWSTVQPGFVGTLKVSETISSDADWFETLDQAMHFVESEILASTEKIRERWSLLHPMYSVVRRAAKARAAFEPFQDILPQDAAHAGCPWSYCSRMEIKQHSTVLWRPGEYSQGLFLVHRGKVGLFASIPGDGEEDGWGMPAAVYGKGWFLNREAATRAATRMYAVALEDGEVLFWDDIQRATMAREQPCMSAAILEALLKQERSDAQLSAEPVEKPRPAAGAGGEDEEGAAEADPDGLEEDSFTSGGNFESDTPEDLMRVTQGVSIAQAIAAQGFFDPIFSDLDGVAVSPPEAIQRDLVAAFQTYCNGAHQNGEGGADAHPSLGGEPTIDGNKVGEALMFAGIFGTMFVGNKVEEKFKWHAEDAIPTRVSSPKPEGIGVARLGQEAFVRLGSQAAMMRMSEAQVEKLHETFKRYDSGRGHVEQRDIPGIFKGIFQVDVTVEEVDGVVNLWTGGRPMQIDFPTFAAIVSRFVRRHEQDWCLLHGTRELMGKAHATDKDLVDVDVLTACGVPEEEAAEMLWVAGCSAGKRDSTKLEVRLLPASFRPCYMPEAELPPVPRTPAAGGGFRAVDILPRTTCPLLVDVRSLLRNKEKAAPVLGLPDRLENAPHMHSEMTEEEQKPETVQEVPDTCRARLHLFLDEPNSSAAAGRWSVVMGVLIMISVLSLFMKPLISPSSKTLTDTEKTLWFSFELFFTAIFTVEFITRLCVADALGTMTIKGFLKKPMNIVDFIAILPFYIDQAINVDSEEFRLLRIVRLMRLSRLVRLGRLARKSATFAPIAMVLVVIWGIYMKNEI